MKNLNYVQGDVAVRNRGIDTPKRPFFKSTAAAVLAGVLSFTAPAAILTMPNKAVAQEVEICGRKVDVVKLDKTVAQMDRETIPYRGKEFLPEQSVSGEYQNDFTVQSTVYMLVNGGARKWTVVVTFPKELDMSGTMSGMRGIDITDFKDYAERLSGQKMERVQFIVERGTFEYEGKNTEYVTAYIYPLNKEGKPITRIKGGDIVLGVSYYGGDVYNATSLLKEPGNQRSEIAKQPLIVAQK